MKPGDRKITIETLAAGQSRAYADTIYTYRVYFHWIPYTTKPTKVWEPFPFFDREENVRPYLRVIQGWDKEPNESLGLGEHKLDFIKKVGPSTWEFSVRELFTD